MKIEMVVTCVRYQDFLAHSLPENLKHVDNIVVVTDHDDKETKDLCNLHSVQCLQTDVFYEHGAPFNKGRGINLGLAHLHWDGWIIHCDADTVLPDRFRHVLRHTKLNPEIIYGADRLGTKTYQNWIDAKPWLTPQYKHGCLVTPHHGFQLQSRLSHGDYGYCPIGFFQMWHSSTKRKYPVSQGSSEHSDVLHAVQWPRDKRQLIPNLFVYHLESENAPMGANWEGRKTKPFGPNLDCKHHKHHHHKPYEPHHHKHHHHKEEK